LTSQFLLSASTQDGFGAAQDNPAAANRAEIHLHNYGEFDKACMTWTDGTRARPLFSVARSNSVAVRNGELNDQLAQAKKPTPAQKSRKAA
jgi:hypothetical protein